MNIKENNMKYIKIYLVISFMLIPYAFNFEKYAGCYENGNSQCEVTHGAGVFIPPLSFLTVWVKTDER